MTKPRRYKRFSSEFKREAIMRASEEGMTNIGESILKSDLIDMLSVSGLQLEADITDRPTEVRVGPMNEPASAGVRCARAVPRFEQ